MQEDKLIDRLTTQLSPSSLPRYYRVPIRPTVQLSNTNCIKHLTALPHLQLTVSH